jgi:hypothetical protein
LLRWSTHSHVSPSPPVPSRRSTCCNNAGSAGKRAGCRSLGLLVGHRGGHVLYRCS